MVKRWTSAAARRIVDAAGGDVDVEVAIEIVADRMRAGTEGPPADLNAIARRLKVAGVYAADLLVAGELRRSATGLEIYYASGMSAGRRRFTVAHEFGHAFFESTGPGCPRVGEELERICDHFAAALLMPTSAVVPELDVWSPEIAVDLARRYGVSLSAILLRADEVGDRHGAILDEDGRVMAATRMLLGGRDGAREDLARLATRALGGFDEVGVLPRNRRWNGQWIVGGRPLAGGRRALLTGVPVDAAEAPIARVPVLRSGVRQR